MSRGEPTFSPETPHFFRIVLEETLSEEKLRIPNKFWRKYGATLDDKVFLNLPCGFEWEMKLTKHNGEFWLNTGWPDFAKHYALERGDLLVFRYQGNSNFRVVIFDTTMVEIDYPLHPEKAGKKPPLQSPRPCKRVKTSPTTPQIDSFVSPQIKDESRPEIKGSDNGNGDLVAISTTTRKTRLLRGIERITALQKASGFKSKRPFFEILIYPSYMRKNRAHVSSKFANKYLSKKSDVVTLKVTDSGRIWFVNYHKEKSSRGTLLTKLTIGWGEFARDNNLKVGDFCVLLLRKGTKISFDVQIFGVGCGLKGPISPDLEGGSVKEELGNSLAKLKPKGNEAGKDKILERARFRSENPFFTVVMRQSHVVCARCYLGVPFKFAKKYITKEGHVMLSDTNGRSWSARLVMKLRKGKFATIIQNGWEEFVNDNNLQVGDFCIFELVKVSGKRISFKVSIVRADDQDQPREVVQVKSENY